MVKQQIAQLNKTLAAFERNDDGDDEVHLEQITTPSDMRDHMEGKLI